MWKSRNFENLKILGKIFAKHKFINCEKQPSYLKKLKRSSSFSTNRPTFKATKCGKTYFFAIML